MSEANEFKHVHVVRFHETDAAGVVYFANLLTFCHEAYEAALAAVGIDVALFFSRDRNVAVPVIHAEADFYRPVRCGEAIAIHLIPKQLTAHSFEIHYAIYREDASYQAEQRGEAIARALTRHV